MKAMLGWVFQFGTGGGEGTSWVDVWGPTAGRGNCLSNRWKEQKRPRSWCFLGVFEEGQGCHRAKAETKQTLWGCGHGGHASHSELWLWLWVRREDMEHKRDSDLCIRQHCGFWLENRFQGISREAGTLLEGYQDNPHRRQHHANERQWQWWHVVSFWMCFEGPSGLFFGGCLLPGDDVWQAEQMISSPGAKNENKRGRGVITGCTQACLLSLLGISETWDAKLHAMRLPNFYT